MRNSIRKKRAVVALAVAACGAVAAAVAAGSGCTTRQCLASGSPWTGGVMLDPNTYATTQLDDDWLQFRSMETMMVSFPPDVQAAIAGRQPATINVYVGTDATPNGFFSNGMPASPGKSFGDASGAFFGGDQFIPATGQLAYLNFFTPGGFWVTNASCANYFVRVVVTYPELPPPPPPIDAGVPTGDGGEATDAPTDATVLADGAAGEASVAPGADAGPD
jgi:hypothetical protein